MYSLEWAPELMCLVIGLGIGTIYGSWVTDGWWKERNESEWKENRN